jgi:cbb3-type cytochrome c oxidase subunit III
VGRGSAAALALATALLAAGCGTGGIAKSADTDRGKQLFLGKGRCAGCHTLAAANAKGTIGPNLDEAFAYDRKQGFEEVTIEQVVRDQIELAGGKMPANLVRGGDADAVAAYVASVAAKPVPATASSGGKQPTSGKDIFTANCGSCHTLADAGTSGTVGPNLDQLEPSFARAQKQVTNGGAVMPAFKGTLTPEQIKTVAKYVASVAGKR